MFRNPTQASKWAESILKVQLEKQEVLDNEEKKRRRISQLENSLTQGQCPTNDTQLTNWKDTVPNDNAGFSGDISMMKVATPDKKSLLSAQSPGVR